MQELIHGQGLDLKRVLKNEPDSCLGSLYFCEFAYRGGHARADFPMKNYLDAAI
jgi:hypothetical protein